MVHSEVVEDILGDDGLRMMEGAMNSLVEDLVASSSDDVVDENLRITSDEDNGDTQVTDATPSNSLTSITAGSNCSPLTPSNCLGRMTTGSWTPPSATEVLQDIPLFSLSGWRILDSSGWRIGIIRANAGNSLKVDCDISGHEKKCKFHIDIVGKFLLTAATDAAWTMSGRTLTADEHHVAASSIKHFDSVQRDG